MATSDALYVKVTSDGEDTQRGTGSRIFKAGILLLGGSCLVLVSIMVISAYSSTVHSNSSSQSSMSLLGMPSSLRTSSRMTPSSMLNQVPASPWKDLALAAIQDANKCGRDVSMHANGVKAVWAGMNSKDRARFATLVKATESGAAEEQVKEEILNIPKSPEEILKAGATGPLGFWDPIGFSANVPTGRLLFYREVELKHGRICMLAALGFLVGEQFHPLFGGDIDVPSYIAFQQTPLQTFWVAVSAAIAIPEVLYSIPTFNTPSDGDAYIDGFTFTMKLDRVPGDLGFDPLGLKPSDPNEFLEMQNKELNNGRLAMIGIAGMIAQELVTGQKLF